ncbi:MAG: AI-2E family transporter, partial [Deltaproteobacteria bacterium]|nr:AI-2E family transporter [Deltaproteobacteria bacterium]
MNKNSTQAPLSHPLIIAASFVIVVAGMRAAEPIIIPFLLAAFIAVICTSPLFWLKQKGVPMGIAILIVLVGIMVIVLVMVVLIGTSLQDFSDALPTYQAQLQQETAK